MPDQYQNLDGETAHTLQQNKAQAKKSKLIVIFSLITLLLLIGGGVAAWYFITHQKGSTPPATPDNSGNSTTVDIGDDPSKFEKDSRLHKSFYGIAYTPEGSLMPNCGNKLENVIRDIQLLSQLTGRIRLYGSDCNQTALVLEAIKQTKVDMEVYLGNYVVPDDNTPYQRQRDAIKEAIVTYGPDHVAGITVGNEFMLNYLTAHQSKEPNGPIGQQGAAILKADIDDTRQMVADMKLSKPILIGTSDAGSFFNKDVLASVDYGMSNVHAWFANQTASAAANWVFNFFDETNVQPASQLPNKPKMYIAETGWPTKSSDAGNANNGGSPASTQTLQTFIDTFVCQANSENVGYFFFEFCDEKWKDDIYGGVEGWWGLFNGDRTLKEITIPDCAAP
ncbi:glycoside hydrolase family 17 protein [Macrolepiota fuliginosa MF-IS2]|uniref:glucan endo-1,3-beta-D-glucosidase n=1 Tax=Macrolepiota fuliginosa MF-IS2 TaxID=1400762 RepID=A0A9P5XK70_9AGAR|nr:glycoside hydrolase family 17 protein [Macrolepiota fuliginosa MF-IS2]